MPDVLKDYKRLFKEWNISCIKSLYQRRYMFRKSALEIIIKKGYSILLNFPEGDYEEYLKNLLEYIKLKNKNV